MPRDGKQGTDGIGQLGRAVASSCLPHPALIALVRLLARSAALEALSDVPATEEDSTDVED